MRSLGIYSEGRDPSPTALRSTLSPWRAGFIILCDSAIFPEKKQVARNHGITGWQRAAAKNKILASSVPKIKATAAQFFDKGQNYLLDIVYFGGIV
jgi:hypothetical protein